MAKIVACIMGQNCEKFIGMCLSSVKDADAIVYCDGGSTDGTHQKIIDINDKVNFIANKYDQEDPKMNGKQRNFYLDYLQKNYSDYWALCLDADEVVEDFTKIKEFVEQAQNGVYSVKMRHLIGDLAHEDNTTNEHFVLNRLFQIRYAKEYPLVEHPVLQPRDKSPIGATKCTTIWHLAYCPNMWDIKKRYECHLKKSNMHTPEFLANWYKDHLFGTYPKKRFNPVELPKVILDEFGIDKDELYFENRGLEVKHCIMVNQWNRFFEPKSITDVGCGKGPYLYSWESMVPGGVLAGYEISKYAIDNKLCDTHIFNEDITKMTTKYAVGVDLVTAIDILEHLAYDDIHIAINNLINMSDDAILISVPVLGDPNLDADPTHIIKETKEWWIKQFTDKGLKLIETPDHFLFKDQILIFERNI